MHDDDKAWLKHFEPPEEDEPMPIDPHAPYEAAWATWQKFDRMEAENGRKLSPEYRCMAVVQDAIRALKGDEPMPKPADWLDPRRPEEWEPATTHDLVEQCDRDAAALVYQHFRDHDYASWVRKGVNAGGDGDWIVQAFAKHRRAALAAALREREAMRDALDRRDAKAAECPIDRPRCVSRPPLVCPRCRAKSNETCFVKSDADCRFRCEIRAALERTAP